MFGFISRGYKTTAGHLSEKNGDYYAVLSYKAALGKRKTKWISTGLPVKGNKKKAEEFLSAQRKSFKPPEQIDCEDDEILFSDYLEQWLKVVRITVSIVTYSSYSQMVRQAIAPYFKKKRIKLKELTAKDIQFFYIEKLESVSANTVIHYHAIIHKALKYAVKIDLVPINMADKVERPRLERFVGSFYDADEMKALLEASKGSRLEIPIMLAAFYGLRRSEVLGLKWDAVDLEKGTITIKHTVTSVCVDGKSTLVKQDRTKTRSSMRTLPLINFVKQRLIALKEEQIANRRLCGKSYNKEHIGYICINEVGDLIKPNYVTDGFKTFLKANGLREIRFHDLRHSCASLLLANGVPMKQIQEWLGHSDFSTTANIYSHLDYTSKIASAGALEKGLGVADE